MTLVVSLLATVGTWALLWWLIPQLRRRLLDRPNARSSHALPIPRGGGLAFVLVGSIACAALGFWMPLWCVPLAMVGLLDDRLGLPVGLRYGAQLLTTLVLLQAAELQGLGIALSPLFLPLLVLVGTALINFTNFMDGLDGLVAGCMTVVLAAAALALGVPLWPLVGALLGFLLWNWCPARVFMGDVGSTFLGAVLAGALFRSPNLATALGLLLVATPMLADAGICVFRRLWAHQPVLQAHRLHLYQRLHQAGWTHQRVTLFYCAATFSLAALVYFGGWPAGLLGAGATLTVGFILDMKVAVPFSRPD